MRLNKIFLRHFKLDYFYTYIKQVDNYKAEIRAFSCRDGEQFHIYKIKQDDYLYYKVKYNNLLNDIILTEEEYKERFID